MDSMEPLDRHRDFRCGDLFYARPARVLLPASHDGRWDGHFMRYRCGMRSKTGCMPMRQPFQEVGSSAFALHGLWRWSRGSRVLRLTRTCRSISSSATIVMGGHLTSRANAVDLRNEAFSLKCEYRISNKEYRIMKLHCAHPNLPVLSINADAR